MLLTCLVPCHTDASSAAQRGPNCSRVYRDESRETVPLICFAPCHTDASGAAQGGPHGILDKQLLPGRVTGKLSVPAFYAADSSVPSQKGVGCWLSIVTPSYTLQQGG